MLASMGSGPLLLLWSRLVSANSASGRQANYENDHIPRTDDFGRVARTRSVLDD